MKYILWFFILLLFSLFILGGYKASVSHPDFPVPLFAMHSNLKGRKDLSKPMKSEENVFHFFSARGK